MQLNLSGIQPNQTKLESSRKRAFAEDYKRYKFSDYCLVKQNDVHLPTVKELEKIIYSVGSQILSNDSLYRISETINSKTLKNLKLEIENLNMSPTPDGKKSRIKFLTGLYKKIKNSSKALKYLTSCGLLNEIKGVYYLGKILEHLIQTKTLSHKDLKMAMKIVFIEEINAQGEAFENLQHYLKSKGFSPKEKVDGKESL